MIKVKRVRVGVSTILLLAVAVVLIFTPMIGSGQAIWKRFRIIKRC